MEITPDTIMSYGLMNKVSTGNSLLDMVLCMLVPLIAARIAPWLQKLIANLASPFGRRTSHCHTRHITHARRSGYCYYYSDDEREPPNHLLQAAVLLYLNTLPDLPAKLVNANVQLCKAAAKDAAADKSRAAGSGGSSGGSDDGSSSSSDDSCSGYEDVLQGLAVKLAPPLGQWIDLEPGLQFMRNESEEANDKDKSAVRIDFQFTCDAANGGKRIDAFIGRAYEHFREQRRKKRDTSRYLHIPVLDAPPPADAEAKDASAFVYKRYKLAEDKTFANLFHPDKKAVVGLVDAFMSKSGKFAISGYPQKLGFLLHGPPGTGKTTFIKALAQYTGRSIISIPLARVRTNQQLFDMMNDQRVSVQGEDMAAALPFDKVIFVMEDVDAAGSVVLKRSQAEAGSSGQTHSGSSGQTHFYANSSSSPSATPRGDAAASGSGGGGDGGVREGRGAGGGGGGRRGGKGRQAGRRAAVVMDDEDDMVVVDREDTEASTSGTPIGPTSPFNADELAALAAVPSSSKYKVKGFGLGGNDELNLAGLLNVLDGVVDAPGRLVVMTTNHPEKLDPALIRPGRINKKIYMGHLAFPEALAMVQHYFGTSSSSSTNDGIDSIDSDSRSLEQALRSVFVEGALSPAALESMCADFEEVGQLLEALGQQHPGGQGNKRHAAAAGRRGRR